MKTMFIGFAFVLVGCVMHLGVFIVASQVMPLPVPSQAMSSAISFSTVVDIADMSSTLRTAHVLTIGGLAIMLLEPAKDLIFRFIDKRRPKE